MGIKPDSPNASLYDRCTCLNYSCSHSVSCCATSTMQPAEHVIDFAQECR